MPSAPSCSAACASRGSCRRPCSSSSTTWPRAELGSAAFPTILDQIRTGAFEVEDLTESDYAANPSCSVPMPTCASVSSTPRAWLSLSACASRSSATLDHRTSRSCPTPR